MPHSGHLFMIPYYNLRIMRNSDHSHVFYESLHDRGNVFHLPIRDRGHMIHKMPVIIGKSNIVNIKTIMAENVFML